jgi:hypothetical protein
VRGNEDMPVWGDVFRQSHQDNATIEWEGSIDLQAAHLQFDALPRVDPTLVAGEH